MADQKNNNDAARKLEAHCISLSNLLGGAIKKMSKKQCLGFAYDLALRDAGMEIATNFPNLDPSFRYEKLMGKILELVKNTKPETL